MIINQLLNSLDNSWKEALKSEFSKPYFDELSTFLETEYSSQTIFPPVNQIFSSLNHTPFDQVKVVILGQDPYHGEGQANGLAFSVNFGVKPPPSLRNIYKELKTDLCLEPPVHGVLESWAKNGVLLLNTVLTVRKDEAASHQKKGWEQFTDSIIQTLSRERQNLVFLLWGNFAISKKQLIDNQKHKVLEAAHPSPLSASRGFLGCHHFSKANTYLHQNNVEPINWQLTDWQQI